MGKPHDNVAGYTAIPLHPSEPLGSYSPLARSKMIDFAHVHPTPDGGRDESYLTGLGYIMRVLRPDAPPAP